VVKKGKICGQKSKICDSKEAQKSLMQQRKMVSFGLKAQNYSSIF